MQLIKAGLLETAKIVTDANKGLKKSKKGSGIIVPKTGS